MEINELTGLILKKAYEVHTVLGPGLLESAYEECLCYELIQCGLNVEKQKALPVVYKNIKVDAGYRLDIVVNNAVIIEIKAVTYLKLSGIKYGLLINFNVRSLKEGIRRYIV
mgnify:CR=1 FL=1